MHIATTPLGQAIYSFLEQVGIAVREQSLPPDTFLPGLLIDGTTLLVDPQRLAYPGDILHEAGHIAVTTAAERPKLGGNLTAGKPEKEGDEIAVLLWTYAACLHLAIDPAVVFHPAGYKGQSDWLMEQYAGGNYIGLPLLVWMGLSDAPGTAGTNTIYPVMKRWLRA